MTEVWEESVSLLTSKYSEIQEEAIGNVRDIIREDLDDPAKADGEPGDTRYAERACKFAARFTGPGAFQLANQLFEVVFEEVANHPSRGTRHLGLPMHEQAICQILLDNYDEAVPRLIMAARSIGREEAQRTLEVNFVGRSCELAAKLATTFLSPTANAVPPDCIERAIAPLGEDKWALLGAVSSLHANARTYRRWPTVYGQARLLDGLRTVAASLETLVRAIGRGSVNAPIAAQFQQAPRLTIAWCLKCLFEGSLWWNTWNALEGLTHFDASNADSDFQAKLSQILSQPMRSTGDATAVGLALATLVRNYAAHSVMIPESVTPEYNRIAGGLYAAISLLPQAAEREGH